jgi:hypothetical protein
VIYFSLPFLFVEENKMTVEDLAREVVGSIDSEQGYLIAQKWITNRFQELSSRYSLKTLLKFGEVVIPGIYKTGTVNLTQGSDVVVGIATDWTSDLVGRFFRKERSFYEIEAVVSPTQITLVSPFLETTANNVSYSIISRRVPLISGIRKLQELKVIKFGRTLEMLGSAEMDIRFPDRGLTATNPQFVAEIGIDTTVSPSIRLFEFYPYPQEDCLLSFTYFTYPPLFTLDSVIPDFVDSGILKEGVMIDLYRFEMGKALKEGRVDIAGYWRNEMRAQETTWERRMIEVAINAGAVDAGTLLLRTGNGNRQSC